MSATEKDKTQKKSAGSEALKRTKIQVRIIGEDFDFREEKKPEPQPEKIEPEKKVAVKDISSPFFKKKKEPLEALPPIEEKEMKSDFGPFAPVAEAESEAAIEESAQEPLPETEEPSDKKLKKEKTVKLFASKEEKELKEAKRIKEIKEKIDGANLGAADDKNDEPEIKDDGRGGVIIKPAGASSGRKLFSFFFGKRREKTGAEIVESHGKKSFLKKIGVSESELPKKEVLLSEPLENLPAEDAFSAEEKKEIKFKKVKPASEKKIGSKILKLKREIPAAPAMAVDTENLDKPDDEERGEPAGPKEEAVVKPRSIKLYRTISFFFIFLTVALVAAVVLFAFVGMTVTVVPKSETVNEKMLVNIFDKEKNQESNFSQEAAAGEVVRVDVSEEGEYKTTGAEIISRDIKGTVTIINEYDYSQPLVASTRLLSSDDKLFKIKDTVNIPAGGEIKVAIYAEEPSEEMAIAPTRFSIPGLPAFKQDKVYAKNDEKFVYETQVKKYVQQTDIDAGVADLKNLLKNKVEEQYGSQYKGNDRVIYEIDKNSIEITPTAKVGEEAGEFTIKIKAVVNIVAFKSGEIKGFAENRLRSIIPNNKKLLAVNDDTVEYSLSNYNFNQGVATLEVNFSAQAALDEEDELVDRKKLVGLTEDQVLKFLESEGKYDSFQVEFSPTFIKRAPQLVDRIKVQIAK